MKSVPELVGMAQVPTQAGGVCAIEYLAMNSRAQPHRGAGRLGVYTPSKTRPAESTIPIRTAHEQPSGAPMRTTETHRIT